MRLVLVGDVHAKVDDLEDCQRLDDRIQEVVEKEMPCVLVYLGDLYDQFAMKNVVVERWWFQALERRHQMVKQYLIVGNHDRPGDSSAEGNALQSHRRIPNVFVVDSVRYLCDDPDFLIMPYYFKAEDFVRAAASDTAKTLLCHQSFIGGRYESGQPIELRHDASAVDAAVLSQKFVVAGHIHLPQLAGKTWYVGAPRWRNNVNDANVERYIYAVDFENGLPKAHRKYLTGDVCQRLVHLKVVEGEEVIWPWSGSRKMDDRFVVDITGTAAFIEEQKRIYANPHVRLRFFQTDRPGPKLSEADGIPAAWGKWESEYQPKHGTERLVLEQMANERLGLKERGS